MRLEIEFEKSMEVGVLVKGSWKWNIIFSISGFVGGFVMVNLVEICW